MSTFEPTRPDRSCVHFADAAPAGTEGAELRSLDGAAVAREGGMLWAIADAFAFPEWFGGNWDAVDDLLRDLSWIDADHYLLVVTGAEALWAGAPRDAGRLVESWQFCAEYWAGNDTAFHLVFVW